MRTCLLLFGLAIGSFALEPEDLYGMWSGVNANDSTSLTEIFYRTDGTMELRWKATYGQLVQWQSIGTWSVVGDTNFTVNTYGWSKYGEDVPIPIQEAPPPLANNQPTFLVPGTPRKLRYKYCDDPGCILDISYLGAAPAFTLPIIGAGVSIRSAKAQIGPAKGKGRSGRLVWRVLRDGWAFDLMGRTAQ